MKEKQTASQGGKNSNMWTAPDGNSVIRFLPAKDGDPFVERWLHYGVGKQTGFLCPKKTNGDQCHVCEYVSKLYKSGSEDAKKIASDIKVKSRYFSAVIVRGSEEEGPMIWSYSKTLYEKILSLVLNPDYGDITDPKGETGVDFELSKTKKPGKTYADIDLTPKRKCSPLSDNKAFASEWLEYTPGWSQMFETKTTEQTAQALDEFHKKGSETVDSSGERGGDDSASKKNDPVKKTVADALRELSDEE